MRVCVCARVCVCVCVCVCVSSTSYHLDGTGFMCICISESGAKVTSEIMCKCSALSVDTSEERCILYLSDTSLTFSSADPKSKLLKKAEGLLVKEKEQKEVERETP